MPVQNTVSSPEPLTRVESGAAREGRYIPTLSLDPKNIELIEGMSDEHIGYVRCAIDAFGDAHTSLQKLSDAREQVKKDPSKTQAQQILIVASEAEKMQDRLTRSLDSAHKRLTEGIASIDKSLQEPLTAKADNSMSGELRALFRGMPDDKRYAAIDAAVKSKDVTVLQAVLGGHHLLSGISAERQQFYTRAYRSLTTPNLVVRLDLMNKALDFVQKRSGLVFTEIQKCLGADWETVKKLRTAKGDADRLLALINNPVQS